MLSGRHKTRDIHKNNPKEKFRFALVIGKDQHSHIWGKAYQNRQVIPSLDLHNTITIVGDLLPFLV